MREEIQWSLEEIAQEEGVSIFYACESGSRAWGFPSPDSDWDVRFLYLYPLESYLSIEDKKEVIERPISGDLDITGWDLKKALRLLRKSNAGLMEWIHSPIVYLDQWGIWKEIRRVAEEYFSVEASLYHYHGMAKRTFIESLQGEQVNVKKIFYSLRPALACQWIEKYNTPPPVEFIRLVEELVVSSDLKSAILTLLERKSESLEGDTEVKNPLIHSFLETEIARWEQVSLNKHVPQKDLSKLDELFRNCLNLFPSTYTISRVK